VAPFSGTSLIISGFTGNPLAKDAVFVIPDVASLLPNITQVGAALVESTDAVVWPNEGVALAGDVITGFAGGLLVAGGFLVPGKSVGAVSVVSLESNGTASSITQLSVDKGNKNFNGWFYHRALLKDVDGDGAVAHG
jgi:hypothetical protein